ncbi:MAG: glycosyltransferase, partial [Victivallales bacterium]|nr:glycosyltransferase [Victivallales bacterium]
MKILQINTADSGGGAEGSAYKLFEMYRRLGHQSVLAVGTKYRDDADIVEIPRVPSGGLLRNVAFYASGIARKLDKRSFPGGRKIARILARLSSSVRCRQYCDGLEETDFPGCHKLLEALPFAPDIVHIHNMHGWYFDIGMLPVLSAKFPTILNLRDTWALTGHCAYFMDCEKWLSGCGNCPRLDVYPALRKDGTSQNWQNKADVYAASRLYVCAPSQWLLDCAKASMLKAAEYKVIPNGIDITVFTPGDRVLARQRLDLPLEVPIVMFASAAAKTVFKDQDTLRMAVEKISLGRPDVHFLCVGSEPGVNVPNMHNFAYISSPSKMA